MKFRFVRYGVFGRNMVKRHSCVVDMLLHRLIILMHQYLPSACRTSAICMVDFKNGCHNHDIINYQYARSIGRNVVMIMTTLFTRDMIDSAVQCDIRFAVVEMGYVPIGTSTHQKQ